MDNFRSAILNNINNRETANVVFATFRTEQFQYFKYFRKFAEGYVLVSIDIPFFLLTNHILTLNRQELV